MKALYDISSAACSKLITRKYSTSFSHGIYLLDHKFHSPICGIYGFVRLADEIVDSFHDYDKQNLMAKFRADTLDALAQKISLNPILNTFQETVITYKIEWELIDTFLKSMEMDLYVSEHTTNTYKEYIVGSAEVVGLMCLRVFTEGDDELYQSLKPQAMKLGAAFQKINFLRDLKADYLTLGRTYFPGVDFEKFQQIDMKSICDDIEKDFNEGLIGIKSLPLSSRQGVFLAYYYYRKLFSKISKTPAEKIVSTRIRIPNNSKVYLIIKAIIRNKLNWLS